MYNVFVKGNEPKMSGAMSDYIADPAVSHSDDYDVIEVIIEKTIKECKELL